MKKLLSRLMVATSFCAVMLSVSCNKEDISPVTTNLYNSMVPIWQQRESPSLHKAIENYVARYGYTLFRDTVYGTSRAVSYLCQTDTAIYLLNVWYRNDSLWSLKCTLFSPRTQWMQEQITMFEQEMYNRHPNDYIGGSFYWYLRPDILNTVDGGDVRTHDLFVQRTVEHASDVWEWVEARTRYGLRPPYLGEDQLQLHTDGTRHELNQLGLDNIPAGITHHLDVQFNIYDTTGWNDWNIWS